MIQTLKLTYFFFDPLAPFDRFFLVAVFEIKEPSDSQSDEAVEFEDESFVSFEIFSFNSLAFESLEFCAFETDERVIRLIAGLKGVIVYYRFKIILGSKNRLEWFLN